MKYWVVLQVRGTILGRLLTLIDDDLFLLMLAIVNQKDTTQHPKQSVQYNCKHAQALD
jgi:hypothetical protein